MWAFTNESDQCLIKDVSHLQFRDILQSYANAYDINQVVCIQRSQADFEQEEELRIVRVADMLRPLPSKVKYISLYRHGAYTRFLPYVYEHLVQSAGRSNGKEPCKIQHKISRVLIAGEQPEPELAVRFQ